MVEICEIWYIKRKENNELAMENEQHESPLSLIPIITQVLDQLAILAVLVPSDAGDIERVNNALIEEGWHFENMDEGVLILRPEVDTSEQKEIVSFVQRNELIKGAESERPEKQKKRGDKMEIVKELINIPGVDFVAVLDDIGEELDSDGNPGRGVKPKELLTQTSIIQTTSAKSGKKLKKGAVKEIVVMWEQGIGILKPLDKGCVLHVITSKEALSSVRLAVKDIYEYNP